jgi:hypothetical protein
MSENLWPFSAAKINKIREGGVSVKSFRSLGARVKCTRESQLRWHSTIQGPKAYWLTQDWRLEGEERWREKGNTCNDNPIVLCQES